MSAASALTGGAEYRVQLVPPSSHPPCARYTSRTCTLLLLFLIPLVAQWQYRPTCTEALCSRLVCSDCGWWAAAALGAIEFTGTSHFAVALFSWDYYRLFLQWREGAESVWMCTWFIFWLHSVQRNTYLVLFPWYRSNKGPVWHNGHLYNL